MDDSPFHPLVWALFFGFSILTSFIVHLFRKRYPNYPERHGVGEARGPEAAEKAGPGAPERSRR